MNTLTPEALASLREALGRMSPRPWHVQHDELTDDECVADEAHQIVLYAQALEGLAGAEGAAAIVWSDSDKDGVIAIVNAADSLLTRLSDLEAALGEALRGWVLLLDPDLAGDREDIATCDRLRALLTPAPTPESALPQEKTP